MPAILAFSISGALNGDLSTPPIALTGRSAQHATAENAMNVGLTCVHRPQSTLRDAVTFSGL